MLSKAELNLGHLHHPKRPIASQYRRWLNLLILAILGYAIYSLNKPTATKDTTVAPEEDDQIALKDLRAAAHARAQELDHHYLSRLIADQGNQKSIHNALTQGEEVKKSNHSATIVMGRLKAEAARVRWVHEKLVDIDTPQIYIVDDPHSTLPHLEKNHGREAAVYLRYIIDNYDNLKDVTFFWHNDEEVWHNNLLMKWNSVESINRMDRENIMTEGYVPSRCDQWPGCPEWIKFNPSKVEHRIDPHRLEEMFVPELFQKFFPNTTDFPPYFAGTCCSQFAVSRDAIRSRPLDVYQRIFDWILEYQYDDRSGMVFEFTWPYLFLGKGTLCPSMHECYCKTYNFCIEDREDVQQLEDWNSLRTRREEVRWQVNFMETALETQQAQYAAQGMSPEEIGALEDKFRPEFERLSEELDRLVNITWSSRERIIKHWKLPPPPVGW